MWAIDYFILNKSCSFRNFCTMIVKQLLLTTYGNKWFGLRPRLPPFANLSLRSACGLAPSFSLPSPAWSTAK